MDWLSCCNGADDDDRSGRQQRSDLSEARGWTNKFLGHVVQLSSLTHALAFVCAWAAIVLNLLKVYLWNQGEAPMGFSDSNFIKLLLLPAKILDTVLIASISTIVLHHVIGHLQKEDGLPLGLLGSAYQTHSLKFLFHKGFRQSFWKHFGLSFALACTALFTALVGWSSTIVLTPNLAWWDIKDSNVYTLSPYLNVAKSRLYPAMLSASSSTSTGLVGCDTASYSSICPGAAFSSLQAWTTSWANRAGIPRLTITDDASQGRRSVNLFQTNVMNTVTSGNSTAAGENLSATITSGTTLPHAVAELTTLFWNYISDNPMYGMRNVPRARVTVSGSTSNDAIAMPSVQVQCASYDYVQARQQRSFGASSILFPTDLLDATWQPPANVTLSNVTITNATSGAGNHTIQWPVNPVYWNFAHALSVTNFTWIDISKLQNSQTSGASIGALYTVPKPNAAGGQSSLLIPCLINAKWAASSLQYDPSGNATLTGAPIESRVNTSISISTQWASLLDVHAGTGNSSVESSWTGSMMTSLISPFISNASNASNSTSNSTAKTVRAIGSSSSGISDIGIAALPQILAAAVTEGLARQAYDPSWPMLVRGNDKDDFHYVSLARNFASDSGQSFNGSTAGLSVGDAKKTILADTFSLSLNVRRYGYGYGIGDYNGLSTTKSSLFLIFGLAVIGVCSVLIVVIHCWANTRFLDDIPRECRNVDHLLAASLKHTLQNGRNAIGNAAHLEEKVMLRRIKGEAVHELRLVGRQGESIPLRDQGGDDMGGQDYNGNDY